MIDKKVILAVILSMGVIFIYPYLLKVMLPVQEGAPTGTPAVMTEEVPLAGDEGIETTAGTGEGGGIIAPSIKRTVMAEPAPSVEETLLEIETPLYKAQLSSHGGSIKRWELIHYNTSMDGGDGTAELINLAPSPVGGTPTGDGEKLMLQTELDLGAGPETVPFKIAEPGDFGSSVKVGPGEVKTVIFDWVSPDGVTVEKTLTFSGDSYSVDTALKVFNGGVSKVRGGASTTLVGVYGKKLSSDRFYHVGPISQKEDEIERFDVGDDKVTATGAPDWVGVEDKYFISAVIPKKDYEVSWTTYMTGDDEASRGYTSLDFAFGLGKGERVIYPYNSYMGPKEFDTLAKEGAGFEEAVEFGFMSFIAKPLLKGLNFFNRFVDNYGIAIIIITIIVKVLFYPLTKTSFKSMKGMQKIQPQVAALRERYKGKKEREDREKMNRELMDLYKRHKINPLGGCFPMLLQIPVFIGLYECFGVAIELRHAPFMLWITDLSAKDPFFVTPILMGASMFLQQKMTPTAMDPTQAKIFLMLPIIFTFVFLNFPAGLVLYWLVNNILTIGQQAWIYKRHV